MADIHTLNIWNLCYNPRNLTFIDIIKGIVPIELTSCVLRLITNRNIAYVVLSNFLNFVYNSVMDKIWKPRCELVHTKELQNNITTLIKHSRLSSTVPISSSSFSLNLYNLDYSLDLISNRLPSWQRIIDFSINSNNKFSLFMQVVTTSFW